ncbi:Hypothetical protein FNO24_1087 [Francisella orientalis FNO24]|uniref:Uncharacterized protein n=1 Tax=Francisella orientalis TaxID=299583 RepID=A0ABN4GZA1_9GAMM|nr:Hypothetical protein FNO24_1087 [Francisella orientalis FNO24]AKN88788.1 Hypothetical protein FNO190_1085 [Francisella orientalis]
MLMVIASINILFIMKISSNVTLVIVSG